MRILVLGGTGAMGRDLVQILANRGNQVDVTSRWKRESTNSAIHFIQGNAHEETFLKQILLHKYDVIVDFMIYNTEEFEKKAKLLCKSAQQYIFLSSARVYADSEMPITETSPRLLDVCKDKEYLETDEYALTKARQENILMDSEFSNWTIIRPYVTYNTERLQLGWMEKEKWLYRALHEKKIVFFMDMLKKNTTLTYGYDVAIAIACLVGHADAMCEVFHITADETCTWNEILDVYLNTIEKETGNRPELLIIGSCEDMSIKFGSLYQSKYDRLFNREFDNTKIKKYCGDLVFTSYEEGLSRCLRSFIREARAFQRIDWRFEGYADRFTKDTTICDTAEFKDYVKYYGWRYVSNLMILLSKIKG